MQNNTFAPLLREKYFENVELLPDGGCRFRRKYTWRTAQCKMTTLDKFDEYEASMNEANCFILGIAALLSGGVISLVVVTLFVLAMGWHTKEDLLLNIKKIVESSKKAA